MPDMQDKLTTVEHIMTPLRHKHAKKRFKPVGKLFCDGFSVNDPMVKISQLEKFFLKKGGIRLRSKNRSWTTKETLSTKPKKFFLRINDYDCTITDALLVKIADLMEAFRKKLLNKFMKAYKAKNKCDEIPSDAFEEFKTSCQGSYL